MKKLLLSLLMCLALVSPVFSQPIGGGMIGGVPWGAAQPISIVETLGAERVTNGGFDADSDWTKGANWAIAAGKATQTAGSTETLSQDLTEVLGEVYKIVYTVSGRTAGTIRVRIQGQVGLLRSTNETFTEYITGTDANVAASRNLHFIPSSTFDGSIDDVSVKVVTSGTLTVGGVATFRSPVRLDADLFMKHGGIITKGDAGYGKPNLVCVDQNDEVAAFFVGGGLWSKAALYITGSMSATIDDNGYFNVLDYGIHANDASDGGMIYAWSDVDAATFMSRANSGSNAYHFLGKDNNGNYMIALEKDGSIKNGAGATKASMDVQYGRDAANSWYLRTGTTGGYAKRTAEATADIEGDASTTITLSVPSGVRLLGAQLRVDTALATGELWDATYSGGSTTALVSAGAVAKSTKANKMHVDEITTDVTNIAITKNGGGSFTAQGTIRAIVYYETFVTMADAP